MKALNGFLVIQR